jgi:hypothetical protein
MSFSLQEETLFFLKRALDLSKTLKYQQLHLPPLSGLFTVMDRLLRTPTGRIYGVYKIDGFKPRSTLLQQTLAKTHPSSSITGALAPQQLTLRPFSASTCWCVDHTLLCVDLTCRRVGPTHCTVRLRRPPPLQLLLFEFFLLCYVTIFLFLLLLLFLCNFFMGFLTSDHPSTVQFQFSAAPLVQQPLHSSCCHHSNGLFI